MWRCTPPFLSRMIVVAPCVPTAHPDDRDYVFVGRLVRSDDYRSRNRTSGNVRKNGRSARRIDPLRRLNARCRDRSQASQIFQTLAVEVNEDYLAPRATAY